MMYTLEQILDKDFDTSKLDWKNIPSDELDVILNQLASKAFNFIKGNFIKNLINTSKSGRTGLNSSQRLAVDKCNSLQSLNTFFQSNKIPIPLTYLSLYQSEFHLFESTLSKQDIINIAFIKDIALYAYLNVITSIASKLGSCSGVNLTTLVSGQMKLLLDMEKSIIDGTFDIYNLVPNLKRFINGEINQLQKFNFHFDWICSSIFSLLPDELKSDKFIDNINVDIIKVSMFALESELYYIVSDDKKLKTLLNSLKRESMILSTSYRYKNIHQLLFETYSSYFGSGKETLKNFMELSGIQSDDILFKKPRDKYKMIGVKESLDEMIKSSDYSIRLYAVNVMSPNDKRLEKLANDRSAKVFREVIRKIDINKLPLLLGSKKLNDKVVKSILDRRLNND